MSSIRFKVKLIRFASSFKTLFTDPPLNKLCKERPPMFYSIKHIIKSYSCQMWTSQFVNFHRHKVKEIISTRSSGPMQYIYSICNLHVDKVLQQMNGYDISEWRYIHFAAWQWRRNMDSATCSYYHWLLLFAISNHTPYFLYPSKWK